MIVNKFQHMDLKEWSHDSNAFKTITSESETRNQTTNKKQHSKIKSSHSKSITKAICNLSIPEINQLISQLEQDKNIYALSANYHKAAKIDKKIKQIQQIIKARQSQIEKQEQQQLQVQVYKQHEQEMREFKEVWEDIFERFQRKEHVMRMRLKTEQQRDIRKTRQKIQYKTAQLDRKMIKNKQLRDLQIIQAKYAKKGLFEELVKMNIEDKKIKVIQDIKSQRNQMIKNLHKHEEQKLREAYRKKHSSLNMKIQQCKQYQVKTFKKHENKLKQKFLNAVSKLDHQNSMRKSRCASVKK